MFNAVKRAFSTKEGKIYLLLMVISTVSLLFMKNINIGRFTFVIYMIPSILSLTFGEMFVKLAVRFMEEEDNSKK